MLDVLHVQLALAVLAVVWADEVPAANLSCSRGIRCESDVTNAYGSFSYRIFVLGNVRQYSDGPRPDYIFTPIFKTLLHGLRSRGEECGYMTGFVDKAKLRQLNASNGDVVVFVSYIGATDFERSCRKNGSLGSRGVYCIFYSTEFELKTGATYSRVAESGNFCEVWEYTRANRPHRQDQSVRYIPPGFMPVKEGPERNDARVQKASHSFNINNMTLFFDGQWTPARRQCWEHLQDVPYFRHFRQHFGVFNDDAWEQLVLKGSNVFVNLHRERNFTKEQKPLETFRVARFLSLGGVVLTDEVNSKDAELYDGMILIEPKLCHDHSLWSPIVRELFTNDVKLRIWKANAYKAFKATFMPHKVLADAGVWGGLSV
ncbi:unnamed protein product [Durusdinium trenchii]|uniref:Uncharacterized protein n=2 Tax=Durusdinium trenchii TaxID=1381693 RepID=A0ABP0KYF2_9DINO